MITANATVWTAPGILCPQEISVPAAPHGGLLLKVAANGICGTDLHLAAGAPPRPTVLGHEIVGTILDFGMNTPHVDAAGMPLELGDRVALFPWIPCGTCWGCRRFGPAAATCSSGFVYGIPFVATGADGPSPFEDDGNAPTLTGGFGSHLVVYPGTYYWRVPETLPTSVASLLDPLAVAVRAVDLARTSSGTWDEVLRPDCTAVIQGAGPVGLLTAMVVRAAGMGQVIVSGARPSRLQAAIEAGADLVLDVRDTTSEERRRAVCDLTGGRGADLVIDCSNAPAALAEAVHLVRRLGTVIEVGNMVNAGSEVRFDPATDICQPNLKLIGLSANPPQSYAEAMALLSRHVLPVESLHIVEMPLRDPAAAFRSVQHDAIKVVMVADAS